MGALSNYLNEKVFFYRYIFLFQLELFQILTIIVWILILRHYRLSGRASAVLGFVLLFISMICNIFGLDDTAGIVAQFVFIFFCMSFIQEFVHFLKHENN